MYMSDSGVEIGAMPPLTEAGRLSVTLDRRSETWLRAQKMSVPSLKSMVMSAIAYLACERSTTWLGMPSISISIGAITRLSTSSGVMPGAFRMIFTCVELMSGKASIGSFRNDQVPHAARTAARPSTSRRSDSARSTSLRSIRLTPPSGL